MSHFIVMTSTAHVKGNAKRFGQYRNVAVVEIEGNEWPKMISPRAKGVVRIVKHYGRQYEGTTDRCQYSRAVRAAHALTVSLNNPRLLLEAAE